jgi:hypothetical protein
MTGGSLPAQAGPAGIAGLVQAVPQRLPAVPGAPQGSVNRDAARAGCVGRMGCQRPPARAQVRHRAPPRSASSASMAVISAWIVTRTGEPGKARARLISRSRLARSSWAAVRLLTWWGRSGTGQPRAVVLFGYHVVEFGLEPVPGWGHGVLLVKERDRAFKLVAEVPELECRQGVQGMFGQFNGYGLGWHR